MQFALDHFDDFAHVFGVVFEVHIIALDDEEPAGVVVADPPFVAFVEALEVIEAHIPFVFPAAGVDVFHEGRDACPEVDEEVGRLDLGGHGFEELEVVVEVARGHQPHVMQVGCEDVGVFVDGAILDDGFVAAEDGEDLLVAVVQEEDLEVERPALHVVVKVAEVGIVVGGFEVHFPAELFAELFAERRFPGADVAGDGNVFDDFFLRFHKSGGAWT